MQPVAIVGWAQTRHEAAKPQRNYMELAFEVTEALHGKLGIGPGDIDTMVSASSDFTDGRTISNMSIQDAVGAPGKSESKVSMDGAFALAYGYARVASGTFGTCLVIAHAKLSEGDGAAIANAAWDPIFLRPLGFHDKAALGLQARRYLDAHRLPADVLGRAAAASYRRAAGNPHALRREPVTSATVRAAAPVADPLTALEIAADADGACCLLLASPERAARFPGPKAWLRGLGLAYDAHSPGARDLADAMALRRAAREAYGRAGISDPRAQLGPVELTDRSACQTLLWAEHLGLCDPGRGVDWMEGTAAGNASGGALAAFPGFAAGLVRVVEAAERLSASARPFALAHGGNGALGQAHAVWILGKE